MIKIFYIVNGSNDLFYPLSKNFNELKEIFKEKKEIEVYCLYKLIKSDPLNIWEKIDDKEYESKEGGFKYSNGSFEEINTLKYYKNEVIKNKEIKYLNVEEFLKDFLREDDYNIVIISGHGGPFQALLDLEVSPGVSINTLELVRGINKFNIELLFLDMCAMNYVEIIYELLYKGKIKSIITYKNFAPFEGINYKKFIEYLERKRYKEEFKYLKEPLIYINEDMLNEIENIRKDMNMTILKGLEKKERKFQIDLEAFRKKKISIGLETEEGVRIPGNTFNYIKYFLSNDVERNIYGQYRFSENNLWNIIIRKELKCESKIKVNVIPIERDGIINIIDIHNRVINENKLKKIFWEFIKIRGEEEIYFED